MTSPSYGKPLIILEKPKENNDVCQEKSLEQIKRGPYLFNEKMVWNNPSLYRGGVP